jgi:hypothetical protein
MKEKYSHEIPKLLRLLGVWRINRDSIDFKWGYFAPSFAFEFVIHRGSYFDCRYALSFALGWGLFQIYLPFKTRLEEGCDMPEYGFCVHSDSLWIYKGGDYESGQCQNKWWTWDLPFVSYEFDGHWVKDKDDQWVLMKGRKNSSNIEPWEFRKDGAYVETLPYRYVLKSGVVQERTATCSIEKRKWHRKWFPFLIMERTVIDIKFNDEVGERSGSWKGGITGCSYDMLPNESIKDCLKRMEIERKF